VFYDVVIESLNIPGIRCKVLLVWACEMKTDGLSDVNGSVHHNTNLIEMTNKTICYTIVP
jgi:hypothetical protein